MAIVNILSPFDGVRCLNVLNSVATHTRLQTVEKYLVLEYLAWPGIPGKLVKK